MGRRKLTAEETETFRAKILDAALDLFATHGFEAVSLRSIAAAVGCSPMTPYRYFRDKSDIFDAVRCLAFERFATDQEAVAAKVADPLTRIRELGKAYSRFADRHPNDFRLMFEFDQPREVSPALADAAKRSFATLREATADAVAAGIVSGDVDTLAHLYWTSLHGIVTLDLAGKLVHGQKKANLLKALFQGG